MNRRDHGSMTLGVSWQEIGLPVGATCAVRDLIAQKDLPKATGNFSADVNAHGVEFVRVVCDQ